MPRTTFGWSWTQICNFRLKQTFASNNIYIIYNNSNINLKGKKDVFFFEAETEIPPALKLSPTGSFHIWHTCITRVTRGVPPLFLSSFSQVVKPYETCNLAPCSVLGSVEPEVILCHFHLQHPGASRSPVKGVGINTFFRKRNTVVMLYRIHNWNHAKRENVTQKMKEYLLDNLFLIEKCITKHQMPLMCSPKPAIFSGLASHPNAGNGKAPATFDDHHSSTALLQLG